jgi:hypothetical protein
MRGQRGVVGFCGRIYGEVGVLGRFGLVGHREVLWLGSNGGGESERGPGWCLGREGSEREVRRAAARCFLIVVQDWHGSLPPSKHYKTKERGYCYSNFRF